MRKILFVFVFFCSVYSAACALEISKVSEAEKEQYRQLDRHIRIGELVLVDPLWDENPAPGSVRTFTYKLTNSSDQKLLVPFGFKDGRGNHYKVGGEQSYIEPLDASARTTDFGPAAKFGSLFAAGGWTIILDEDVFEPRKEMNRTISVEAPLKPGRYRFILELKSLLTDEVNDQAQVEFEIE